MDYLRRNEFKTWRKLDSNRRKGDPTVWDYRKEFGSWLEAKYEAFGREAFRKENTPEYLVKVVVKYSLWTAAKYKTARKMRPDIIPAYHHVERLYKFWKTLVHFAEEKDARRILDEYMKLKRRLGRLPSTKECHEHDVDVRRLIVLFGGKQHLYQNVLAMEKEHERRKRSNQSA